MEYVGKKRMAVVDQMVEDSFLEPDPNEPDVSIMSFNHLNADLRKSLNSTCK